MSNTLLSKRKFSELQPFINASNLIRYINQIIFSNITTPKKYRPLFQQFISKRADDILLTLCQANKYKITTENFKEHRISLLEDVEYQLNTLENLIIVYFKLIPNFPLKRYEYLSKLIIKLKTSISAWKGKTKNYVIENKEV